MDIDTLYRWIPVVFSTFSLYYAYQANSDRKKQIKNMNLQNDIAAVRKVFPVEIDSKLHCNTVGVYNNSGYPIYDIFVLQGLDNFQIEKAQHFGVVRYIRTIKPKTKVEVKMENAGLDMCKYYVAGIFFRDYKGNEWFRDSMGKLSRADHYKEMLNEKKIAVPPYSPALGNTSSLN